MSNFSNTVDLTISDKLVWRPAKEKEKVYKLVVQVSPSGRARCRKCSQCVAKGELRCGLPIKHQMGEFGYISAWQHLSCTRVEEENYDFSAVKNFDTLSEEQQREVVTSLTSKETPPHLQELDPDDLIKRDRLPQMEPPTTLLRPLLPYQKEGFGWMVRQEESDLKGGILADEMGMGKTIQTIALFLARKVQGPTLVVCPVSSMMQWENEIQQHVMPNTLSVVVVYKTSKIDREALENADIVLTTYPMIEQVWRNLVNQIKVQCPYCDQLFIPRQLVVHNKYFCGPKAKKTAKQRKREKLKQRNNRVQSLKTIRKGLKTLHVEIDEEEEEEVDKSPKEKGVVGPIGMYQELMREAGRTVRSRWDPSRKKSDSESQSSSSSSSSEESDSSEEGENDDDEDENAGEQEKRMEEFKCQECGFQLLYFPFCPKTGQHHIITEEQRKGMETDTDGVNLSKSVFHSIRWARIVLDEAHRIKGRTTSTARSAFALEAEYRWCLTGTPLQNRVGDLYSLLRFLRMEPYSRYYCATEGCSCSSLSHPFSGTNLRQCVYCGHGPLSHYAYFNRYILNPINRYGYIGEGRMGMMMLGNDVFSKAMLRRTKQERAADLHLPPLNITCKKITLTPEERNFYEALYKKMSLEYDTFVDKGTVLHNYAHIFQLLSRLRQALDHPYLVASNMSVGSIPHAEGLCGLCGEGLDGESVLRTNPCRHTFHRFCLRQFLESSPDTNYCCPTCFVRINIDLRQLRSLDDDDEEAGLAALPPDMEENEEEEGEGEGEGEKGEADNEPVSPSGRKRGRPSGSSNGTPSTKKASILSRIDPTKPLSGTKLHAISDYIASTPAEDKVIVFSQFGDMLDLVQYWLQRRGIKAVKLSGSLTLTQRLSVLQAFSHDPSVKAILISLKAGGEGLNLQMANHVILTDPWWNPAVEMQAIQRAHRIGQQKPVHAIRYVTENTVEERMVDLQDKKMLVFEGTIDGKMQALNKLTSEDIQFLFTR